MTFKFGETSSAPANNTGAKQQRDARKTIGYINFYVPLKDGSRIRLCSDLTLRLYEEVRNDKALVEALKSCNLDMDRFNELLYAEITYPRDEDAPIEFGFAE